MWNGLERRMGQTREKIELHIIIYLLDEFKEDALFLDKVKRLEKEVRNLNFLEVHSFEQLDMLHSEECLWITGRKAYIQMAKERNIAVLGYQGAGMAEFLPVEYVVMDAAGIEETYLRRVFWRFHDLPWEILETKRCLVREFAMEDLDALFALYAKPGMTDYVEPLYSYEEEAAYQKAYIRHRYRYYGYGMWLVFDKESGQLIGRAGLEDRDYPEGTTMELGYMIAPEYQRKGYATEVCRAILTYAKEELEAESLNCLVDEKNVPSVRLVEKLGFTYKGKTDVTGVILNRYNIDFFR